MGSAAGRMFIQQLAGSSLQLEQLRMEEDVSSSTPRAGLGPELWTYLCFCIRARIPSFSPLS